MFNIKEKLSPGNHTPTLNPGMTFAERLKKRRNTIQSFEAKFIGNRSLAEKFADSLTDFCGSIKFFALHGCWFIFWLLINSNLIPGIRPFDPFPFGLLTMVVSLEAIFLSIFVLISQNRQARIADLREEIDLQVNLIAESEITKTMHMIYGLYKALNVKVREDADLKQMMRPLNADQIEKKLAEQMRNVYKI
ncbi:MAG: hypothetical protein UR28_C0002G0002 [Candidatus Peregrinibacteria bacterium GW2011_GWF2_33_10]|nr:MAG: hypothetical protein UR28_C0002G0002 [Candidatus Peregrinibacteria bacterium GW2011_GWF2_33_10]OGJ45587.1 MAG: hypothetical protein A2263_00595 [Candidatus Peregrinibacteria bacterium RIFOXYA2_FULL_33_21]OGJ45965.1 MAG: hypothetical protein A2272_04450 [Candidatus Peregrinibacteria bacterium RIFOXYA12_FULL_33_12]OGJ51084.1 MAG: hypothetical protein A2307_06415 [Candidatus Peregrinibacteria bacterium RIFOXYB2_FULL_33_20]